MQRRQWGWRSSPKSTGTLFDRIQLIRKKRAPDGKDHYFRLDVGKESVRKKVLRITSNDALDQVFDEEAKAQ